MAEAPRSDEMTAWLRDQLERGYGGSAWHGDSLKRLLDGVDARAASARPLPAAHSIWELVLHMAFWARAVTRRLSGGTGAVSLEGNWSDPGEATPERWAAAVQGLEDAHAELDRAIAAFPPDRWGEPLAERDPAADAGITYADIVNGLVQHDAYHGGQIGMLKKAI